MKSTNHFITLAILPALVFQFIGALFYFVIFPNGILAQGIYTTTKILLLIWPLLWLRQIKTPWNLRPNASAIRFGLESGIIGAGVILLVFFIFQDYFSQFSPQLIDKITAFNLTSPTIFFLFAIFISLVHSLLEEYYWRWFVFTNLTTKFSPLVSGLITSIGFASHHYIILSQFFSPILTIIFGTLVGVGGAWWCYVYKKTGTLFSAWISHAMIDVAIMAVGYILIF